MSEVVRYTIGQHIRTFRDGAVWRGFVLLDEGGTRVMCHVRSDKTGAEGPVMVGRAVIEIELVCPHCGRCPEED